MFKTTSYIELNQQALTENVKFLKEIIGPKC